MEAAHSQFMNNMVRHNMDIVKRENGNGQVWRQWIPARFLRHDLIIKDGSSKSHAEGKWSCSFLGFLVMLVPPKRQGISVKTFDWSMWYCVVIYEQEVTTTTTHIVTIMLSTDIVTLLLAASSRDRSRQGTGPAGRAR